MTVRGYLLLFGIIGIIGAIAIIANFANSQKSLPKSKQEESGAKN
jgi:hypothetical protein